MVAVAAAGALVLSLAGVTLAGVVVVVAGERGKELDGAGLLGELALSFA